MFRRLASFLCWMRVTDERQKVEHCMGHTEERRYFTLISLGVFLFDCARDTSINSMPEMVTAGVCRISERI